MDCGGRGNSLNSLILTRLSVLHLAVVPMRLRQDAGSGRVPLQLIQAAVGQDAPEDWSALQVSCDRVEEQPSEAAAATARARRRLVAHAAHLVCT